jgi:hypothetical protein
MNGFDVRALGWVVTRDVCSEMARTAFGARPRMSPAMLREQRGLWRDVQSSLRADGPQRLDISAIRPLAAPLSIASERAIAEFVRHLVACCPDLYSEPALRTRWLERCAAFAATAGAGAILAHVAPPDTSMLGDLSPALLLIAGWSLVTAIQLWRTRRLVERMLECEGQEISAVTR